MAIASVNLTLETFKGTVTVCGLPHRLCTSTGFLQWGRTSSPSSLPSWCRCCWQSASPCESPARKQTSAEPLRGSKWRAQVSGELNNINCIRTALPTPPHTLSLPWAIEESTSSKIQMASGRSCPLVTQTKISGSCRWQSTVDWSRQEWSSLNGCAGLFMAVLLQLKHVLLIDWIDFPCLPLHLSFQATGLFVCPV